jgi:hypothetical protein
MLHPNSWVEAEGHQTDFIAFSEDAPSVDHL